jgi:hypothetical protein
MEKLYLHAVVVKKPMPLPLARVKAQKIIKNKKKTFVEETEESFRFRNLPKVYFKEFVSKPLNDEITLVLGHLKDRYKEEMETKGKEEMEKKDL